MYLCCKFVDQHVVTTLFVHAAIYFLPLTQPATDSDVSDLKSGRPEMKKCPCSLGNSLPGNYEHPAKPCLRSAVHGTSKYRVNAATSTHAGTQRALACPSDVRPTHAG